MANPSVTNTFSNGATADASQVNTNFTDLISGATDGTKDYNINALTCNGTTNIRASVTLGLSSSSLLTVNASLASSIPIGTTNTYDIGSATLGLASIYFGSSGGAFSTRLKGGAVGSSITLTLPTSVGASGDTIYSDGAGAMSFGSVKRNPDAAQNYSLAASVAANALTIALKDASGADASASSQVTIAFRSATATTGTVTNRTVSAALSIVVPSGATLGHFSAHDDYVYVYAIDNAGTVELAVSGQKLFDDGARVSTTAVTAGSTSSSVLYATNNRTNVAARFLGRIQSNQTTAGTYAAAPTELASQNALPPIVSDWFSATFTGSWTSNTTYTGVIRRVGDSMQGRVLVALSGAPTAIGLTITLPLSLTIDTNKVVSTTSNEDRFGTCNVLDGGTTYYRPGTVAYASTTTLSIMTLIGSADVGSSVSESRITQAAPITFGNTDKIFIVFEVPISGWSATR